MNRHDMLVELASDQVNQVQQLLDENSYESVHSWLQPMFLEQLKIALADLSDEDLEAHYCDQLGVDIPSSPPLSFDDEHTQDQEYIEACFGKATEEAANRRSMSRPSAMECSTLSGVYPVSNEEGLAEVATALRSVARCEETLLGIKSETEIRIPMRLLLRLVHGKGSFS